LSVVVLALAACGGGKQPSPADQPATPPADTAPRGAAAAGDAPLPAMVYGDARLPVAGEVLGTVIHTQDAEELQFVVLQKLTDRYAAEKGIDVTDAEKAAYIEHMREALSRNPNFSGPLPGNEESVEDKAAREEIAAAFIRQWKVNRALYQQYGGRIIFQQGGPEPLDAYRKFLEESAARGDFTIANPHLDAGFWRYYRDDSIHDFFKPGSAEEAKAFADPPWLAD
jgi:hypothetical protein